LNRGKNGVVHLTFESRARKKIATATKKIRRTEKKPTEKKLNRNEGGTRPKKETPGSLGEKDQSKKRGKWT